MWASVCCLCCALGEGRRLKAVPCNSPVSRRRTSPAGHQSQALQECLLGSSCKIIVSPKCTGSRRRGWRWQPAVRQRQSVKMAPGSRCPQRAPRLSRERATPDAWPWGRKLQARQTGLFRRDWVCVSVCSPCGALVVAPAAVPWDPGAHAALASRARCSGGSSLGMGWAPECVPKLTAGEQYARRQRAPVLGACPCRSREKHASPAL